MMAVRFLRLASLYAAASLATFQPALSQEKPTVIGLSPYLGVIWSIEADVAGEKRLFCSTRLGGSVSSLLKPPQRLAASRGGN